MARARREPFRLDAGEARGAAESGETAPRAHEPEHLVVGHVSKPHGTRGEVFVWPLTDRPEVIFADDAEVLLGGEQGQPGEAPETLRVERSRPFKRGLLIKFDG
ncbi:MAG: hypothetical protein HY561_08925, partial [Gemmatimonadetes bacterium]|nr:hypothetical protein [Gemmatimonadota bacterium]